MANRNPVRSYPTADSIQKGWAAKVRASREARRMTIEQVAALLDVRPSTVSRWETWRSNIPDDVKLRLAGLFGVHPSVLFAWPAETPPMPLPKPARKAVAA